MPAARALSGREGGKRDRQPLRQKRKERRKRAEGVFGSSEI
jgi:hypothetical protein